MTASSDNIRINRAPVLTLWAAVVAERLGFDRPTALTLGQAVAGLSAHAKGVALGIIEPTSELGCERGERPAERLASGARGARAGPSRGGPEGARRGPWRGVCRSEPTGRSRWLGEPRAGVAPRYAAGAAASHSLSFDQRRRSCRPLTASATALGCATSTTSRLPRVTAV